MLRAYLGDGPFFATLRHFLRRYAFDAVDTADFIRSVKTVTGQNLDWFFDQWLTKPGHPVFEVASAWDGAAKAVRLRVVQAQDFARGVPVFRVPVSIKIVTAGGTDVHELWIDEREETFVIPATEKPLLVRFDPDNVLLMEVSFPKDVEELLFQLGHDDVIGRMDAATALAAVQGDPRTAAALAATLRTDPFWAVRKAALEALARLGVKARTDVFKRACRDADPQVRAAAVTALGSLGDRGLVGFYKDLFRTDPSFRVQAEALTAVGQAGDPAAAPFLRQTAAVPSYRDIVRRAAEAAFKLLEKR
jgi:aminopeptidase N